MTTKQAILLSLSISGLIIGYLLGIFDKLWGMATRQIKQWQQQRAAKRRSKIEYPLHLATITDIHNYIRKNEAQLPIAKDWGNLLVELIREMSAAGWHTAIPLYAVYEEGHAQIYVLHDNRELKDRLSAIIDKYEDMYDQLNPMPVKA